MQQGKFDLEDFLSTMKQMKKLGPLENLLKLIPGAKKMGLNNVKIDPKQLAHIEAIVLSMTPKERRHPEIIKANPPNPKIIETIRANLLMLPSLSKAKLNKALLSFLIVFIETIISIIERSKQTSVEAKTINESVSGFVKFK